MNIPMTPSQAAKKLGVANVTIYKWIESKKLRATSVQTGHVSRIYIDPQDIEMKRIELEQSSMKANLDAPPMEQEAKQWVQRYQDLIGKVPALYMAFRQGKATFEQMKSDAIRRFDTLR